MQTARIQYPFVKAATIFDAWTDQYAANILLEMLSYPDTSITCISVNKLDFTLNYWECNGFIDIRFNRLGWKNTRKAFGTTPFSTDNIIAMRPRTKKDFKKEGWWYLIPSLLTPAQKGASDDLLLINEEITSFAQLYEHPRDILIGGRFSANGTIIRPEESLDGTRKSISSDTY